MAQLGTLEVYTSAHGWVEIPVFETDDYPGEPLEVYTPNGWGAVPTTDGGSNATPLEIYTASNGWVNIASEAATGLPRTIEDFNENSPTGWAANTGPSNDFTTARAAFQGNYGLHLDSHTGRSIISSPNWSLPRYPREGDNFDIFFRPATSAAASAETHWIGFGIQGYPTDHGYGDLDQNSSWGNGYQVNVQTYNNRLKIQNNHAHGSFNTDLADEEIPDLEQGQWYRLEIDWRNDISGLLFARLYEVSKTNWNGRLLNDAATNEHPYSGPGAIQLGGYGIHYDMLRWRNP